MNKFTKILMVSSVFSGIQTHAAINVMTDSLRAEEADLTELLSSPAIQNVEMSRKMANELTEDGFLVVDEPNDLCQSDFEDFQEIQKVSKNRSKLIGDAALIADAAYNHTDLVSLKAQPNREQYHQDARERLVAEGKEIISFNATMPRREGAGEEQLPAGLVTYSVEDGQPIIRLAYHGTENDRDLSSDLDAWKKSDKSIIANGYMHGGFYKRYMQSREAMLDTIQMILDVHNLRAEQVNFVVTGHSLGAALGTIAAVDLKKTIAAKARLDLVTFSSPRVFDASGAAEAERVLAGGQVLRVWRANDPIAAVSLGTAVDGGFATGFKHVGTSIKLNGVVDSFSLQNHSMGTIQQDARSSEAVTFDTNHKGFWDRAKSFGKKINILNWW